MISLGFVAVEFKLWVISFSLQTEGVKLFSWRESFKDSSCSSSFSSLEDSEDDEGLYEFDRDAKSLFLWSLFFFAWSWIYVPKTETPLLLFWLLMLKGSKDLVLDSAVWRFPFDELEMFLKLLWNYLKACSVCFKLYVIFSIETSLVLILLLLFG